MDISMIEYPKYYWHVAFGHKRLCYERATAGTLIFRLLYTAVYYLDLNDLYNRPFLPLFWKMPSKDHGSL